MLDQASSKPCSNGLECIGSKDSGVLVSLPNDRKYLHVDPRTENG